MGGFRMSLSLVPVGTVVAGVYYAVPEHYGPGEPMDWDGAVTYAQQRHRELSAVLASNPLMSPVAVAQQADRQVVVALRWELRYPDGSGLDTEMQRWDHVMKLRPRHVG